MVHDLVFHIAVDLNGGVEVFLFAIALVELAGQQTAWGVGAGVAPHVVRFPGKSPEPVFIAPSAGLDVIVEKGACHVGILVGLKGFRHMEHGERNPAHIIGKLVEEARRVGIVVIPVVGM